MPIPASASSPIESSAPRPSRSRKQSFARCTVSVRKAGEHLEEQWAARGRSCSYRQRTRAFAKAGPCRGDGTGAESTLDKPSPVDSAGTLRRRLAGAFRGH